MWGAGARVLAVAAAVLALSAAAGRAGGSHTLAVPGSVESISADGGWVAIHVGREGSCGSGELWQPASGRTVALKDTCSSDTAFDGLALAGDAAIWWDWSSGNHVYCDDVFTGSAARPKAAPLGLCDGSEGDTYYEFAGDRTLTAVADYSVCEADCTDANGNLLPDGDYGVEVRRLVGGKVVPVLKPVDFRRFLDAGNWRVAVVEPKDTLVVYDTAGTKLWSAPGVTGVRDGWIVGNTVAVQQGAAVRAFSPAGAGPARHLPKGARIADVTGGLAVYTAASTLHVLRLSDGRDRKVVTVRGLADAQITPAGVFYSADAQVKASVRGSVTFVPIATVLRALR